MTNNDTTSGRRSVGGVSRRRYLTAVGTTSTVALAGYVGDAANAQQTSLQVAMPAPVANNADATREALQNAGLSEDIQVEFLTTSEITDDVRGQYRQWLSAGRNKPDVFRMDSGWTIPFIERGQLVNLSERLSDDAKSLIDEQYFEASVNTATGRDGNLYGVPWQVGFPTVQYRKDVVESAGFEPENENWATEPMSWQNFGEIIAQSHDQSDIEFGYAWQGNDYGGLSCCTFNEFMSSWGGAYFGGRENLFGPVGERPVTVDEEPVLNALRMARTFVQGSDDDAALDGFQSISPEAVLQWTEGPSLSSFTDGNSVAVRYWPSGVPQGVDAFGEDLGVMPIPYGVPEDEAKYEGLGGSTPALGGWHLTVNPNSNNVDAAVQFIEATMQQDFREFQFGELGFLTGDRRLFDPDIAPDTWAPHIETLRIAGDNAVPRPVTVVWPDESPLISSEINQALSAQKAPEKALSDLKGSLQEVEESV